MKLWFPLFFVLYELCGYLSNDMYLPAMLSMSSDFVASLDLVQLSIGLWLIGNGLAQVILGPVSDRFGRKPVLMGGGLVYIFTLLACGLASTITQFLVLRFIQGMGVASIMIAGYATIHENFDDKKATRILAITGSVSILAPMLGPLFGALILEAYSWRMIFLLLLIPTILVLLPLFLVTPSSNLVVNKISLLKSFSRYKEVFTCREFIGKSISYGLHYGTIMLWITSSPYLLMSLGGMAERQYSLWQIPIFLALVAGANSIRLLEMKLSYASIIRLGQYISLVGALTFGAAALFELSREGLVLSFLPITLGVGLLSSPLARKAMTAPKLEQGVITGAFFLIMSLTGGLATMIISFFAESAFSLALCVLVMAILGIFLVKISER